MEALLGVGFNGEISAFAKAEALGLGTADYRSLAPAEVSA